MSQSGSELVIDRRSGQLRPPLPQPPMMTSATQGWRGVLVEVYSVAGFENQDVVPRKDTLIYHMAGRMEIDWETEGQRSQSVVQPGQVSLMPAHCPFSARSRDSGQFAAIILDPAVLLRHCPSAGATFDPRLRPVFGASDPLLAGLCQALLDEAKHSGPAGPVYVETLMNSLVLHLAGRYGSAGTRVPEEATGLQRRELQQALDYIDKHLETSFGLTELSAAAGLSQFHFSRLFKKATGQSPYRFVLHRRLQRARELLLEGSHSVADVAVQVGFCDQSHFSNHFKRAYGMTPRRFLEARVKPVSSVGRSSSAPPSGPKAQIPARRPEWTHECPS